MSHLYDLKSWLCFVVAVGLTSIVPAQEESNEGLAPESPPAVVSGPSLTPLAERPNWMELKKYDGILTRAEFEQIWTSIYEQRDIGRYVWKLDDDALMVPTSAGQLPLEIKFRTPDPRKEGAFHQIKYWRSAKELPKLKESEPVLKGLNIALDPGHIGGDYAQIEERHLSMKEGEAVREGSLMLQLAKLLKPRLEALGATVTLVRTEEAPVTQRRPEDLMIAARSLLNDFGIPNPLEKYDPGMGEQKIFTVRWQAEKLFYRVSEIRARAEKVNQQIRPDLVLALHLNAEAWGDPNHPSFVDKNHLHILVNGAYSPKELHSDDIRFDMIHRVFQQISPEEVALSKFLGKTIQEKTGLPAFTYTTPNAKAVEGSDLVFARNLLANRLYFCPVIYFEPYVMNHELTYRRLILGHFIGKTLLDGQWVTSPLEDYARGVIEGLTRYYKANRN